jgi:hypothetical protein
MSRGEVVVAGSLNASLTAFCDRLPAGETVYSRVSPATASRRHACGRKTDQPLHPGLGD